MWKAITILFLVGASSVCAFDNTEQLGVDSVMQLQSGSSAELVTTIERQSECLDNSLASAAREFLNPPAVFIQSPDNTSAGFMTLPAVPAAIFMVLCGFFCVVFVNERRVLLVALAGLFWAGQAGINAIPKLVLRLAKGNSISQPAQLYSILYHRNFSGLSGNYEDTRYAGLLRHLAGIPASNFKTQIRHTNGGQVSNFKYDKAQRLLDAIAASQPLNSLFSCPVKKTEHITYFMPAFIFGKLARGPPR